MVTSTEVGRLGTVRRVVGAYVAIALGTVLALAVLSMTAPSLATPEAWGHAVIVGVLAIVLALRARAVGKGSVTALRAVTIVGCVLMVANIVEAALPGAFPSWMRVEMVVIAALMATLVVLAVRARHVR